MKSTQSFLSCRRNKRNPHTLSHPSTAEFVMPLPEKSNHFSNVFVFHKASRTIHNDDNILVIENMPFFLKMFGFKDGAMYFHPSLKGEQEEGVCVCVICVCVGVLDVGERDQVGEFVLSPSTHDFNHLNAHNPPSQTPGPGLFPTPEAPMQYRCWVQKMIADWDFDNICTAHTGNKIGGAKQQLQETLDKAGPTLEKIARRNAEKAGAGVKQDVGAWSTEKGDRCECG